MKLEEARGVGEWLVGRLAVGCERVEVAGSVRRGKAEVKDLEIVVVPKVGARQVGFWDSEAVSLFEVALGDLLRVGGLARDDRVRRWGPKYKRAVHVQTGLVVELFVATLETWGYVLALRTGPGDFNKIWASHEWDGGCLPYQVTLKEGQVLVRGAPVAVPEERDFFEVVGIPCWSPGKRSALRLREWLAIRQRGARG